MVTLIMHDNLQQYMVFVIDHHDAIYFEFQCVDLTLSVYFNIIIIVLVFEMNATFVMLCCFFSCLYFGVT